MGTKIKATVVAAALTGAMLLAPTTAQAAPVQEAKLAGPVLTCVETSFWGRLWALSFQRSYASYLWLNRC